jgi:dipeptide/tripeptide permease
MERMRGNQRQQSILCRKSILAILLCESAERVAYFGFRAVLVLYFTELGYTESISVSLCAAVAGLAYASPLLGAVLADSVWGRFLTIWRFGASYAVGLAVVTVAAYCLQYDKSLPLTRGLTFIGLFLACAGTGGIKPCVSAFGADQVILGEFGDDNDPKDDDHGMTNEDVGSEDTAISIDTENEYLSPPDATTYDIKGDSKTDRNPPNPPKGSKLQPNGENSIGEAEAIREFFNSFYVAINVGALLAFTFIPVVRAKYGFGAAFLLPCIAMISALAVFMSQRKTYKHRPVGDHTQYPLHPQDDSELPHHRLQDYQSPSLFQILQACLEILKRRAVSLIGRAGIHTIISTESDDENEDTTADTVNRRFTNQQEVYKDAASILHILPIILFYPVFWMLYDQQASVWTLQATRMNLHGLEPEQLQLLNPLEIMVLVPLFDRIIYPWMTNMRINIEPLRRMEGGMFLTAVSFLACAWLEHRITTHPVNTVSVAWQIPQITIITIAEILLNVTGLEFAYSQAPPSMQTLILALYLLQTAIGDGLASILFATVFSHLTTFVTMVVCAICMLINLFFFSRFARRWTPYRLLTSDPLNATATGQNSELELQRIHDTDVD